MVKKGEGRCAAACGKGKEMHAEQGETDQNGQRKGAGWLLVARWLVVVYYNDGSMRRRNVEHTCNGIAVVNKGEGRWAVACGKGKKRHAGQGEKGSKRSTERRGLVIGCTVVDGFVLQ